MALRGTATYIDTTAAHVNPNLVAPAGVIATDVGILVLDRPSGSATTVTSKTSTNGNAVFTPIADWQQTDHNQYFGMWLVTGVTAGETITITLSTGARHSFAGSWYSGVTTTGAVFGTMGNRGGLNVATLTIPGVTTPSAGCTVVVAAAERLGTGSASVTFTSGPISASDVFLPAANSSADCTCMIGSFTEAAADTTASEVLTYPGSSTNASGIMIALPATGGGGSPASATASLDLEAIGGATAPGSASATASMSIAASTVSTGTIAAGTASLSLSASGSATPPTLTSMICGGVDATTAKVRIDSVNASSAVVTAATNTGLTTGVVTSSSVTPDANGLSIATLTGLTPGTDYFYGVSLSGGSTLAARGKFRTAQTGAYSFSFAAASCVGTAADPAVLNSIYTRTGATGKTAEFFTHLGDLHYRNDNTASLTTILSDYRAVIAKTNHAALFSALPVEYQWSDHDTAGDNCDSTTFVSGGIAAYRSAFNAYFPTYDLPAVNTDLAPWRSRVRGRIRFIWTDGRTYMSAIAATDNSSKTKLGATQKQWLKDETLAAKNAGQAIIWFHEDGGWVSTNPFTGDDTWAAYQTERTELVNYWTSIGVLNRIMIIHGDFHAIAADNGTNSAGGIPVVCASPMSQTYYMPSQDHWSVGVYPATNPGTTMNQYGWFDVSDSGGASLTVTFTGYSNDGTSDTSRMTMAATLAAGSPATATASLSFSASGGDKAATSSAGLLSLAGSLASTQVPSTASALVSLAGSGATSSSDSGTALVSLLGSGATRATGAGAGLLSLLGALSTSSPGSGVATLILGASGATRGPAISSALISFSGSETVRSTGSGSALLTLTGVLSSNGSFPASGTAALSLSGLASGGVPDLASALISLVGAGSPAVRGNGTAVITLSASGTGLSRFSSIASILLGASGGAKTSIAPAALLSLTGLGGSSNMTSGTGLITFAATGSSKGFASGTSFMTLYAATSAITSGSGAAFLVLSAIGEVSGPTIGFPTKMWNGSSWIIASRKSWTGTSWLSTPINSH